MPERQIFYTDQGQDVALQAVASGMYAQRVTVTRKVQGFKPISETIDVPNNAVIKRNWPGVNKVVEWDIFAEHHNTTWVTTVDSIKDDTNTATRIRYDDSYGDKDHDDLVLEFAKGNKGTGVPVENIFQPL